MMPCNLFRLQFMETFGNRRHTVIRIGVSVLLALPFIVVSMPDHIRSSGLVMVILFTSFFGSAVAHARLCEDGRFSRLMLLPMPRPLLWLDLILASAVSRLIPTLILLAGFVLFNSPALNAASLLNLTALLCGTIVLLTLLGTLTGHWARSSGEVHLFGALACVMIACVSGLAPGVEKLMPLTDVMDWNPVSRLLSALIGQINAATALSVPEWITSSIVLTLLTLAVFLRWTAGQRRPITQNN